MEKSIIILTLILFTFLQCRDTKYTKSFDIIIYGGTSSGVIAAYAADKLGKSVLLIEPGNRLGGLSSGGLGQTDIGNKYAVTGLSRDFYRKIGDHYGKLESWTFEPKVALKVFNDYLKETSVEVMYENRIIDAEKENEWIPSITVENIKSLELSNFSGRIFIDCHPESFP